MSRGSWSVLIAFATLCLPGREATAETAPTGADAGEQHDEGVEDEGIAASGDDVYEEDLDDSAEAMEARRRFRQGLELARNGNCQDAIVEFRAALEHVRRPEAIYNLAQCQEQLHRYDLALAGYREFLEVARPGDPDRTAVEATVRLLERLLATLAITTNVPAEVWVDGYHVGDAPGNVLVPSESGSVELRAEGFFTVRREVELTGGQQLDLQVTLAPVDSGGNQRHSPSRLHPAYFWVGVSGALLSAAIATGLGSWALAMRNDVRETDPRLRTFEQIDRIDRVALLTDVFWGITGALAITAIILGVMTEWRDREPNRAVQWRVWPTAWGLAGEWGG